MNCTELLDLSSFVPAFNYSVLTEAEISELEAWFDERAAE
jgi:hypothetical protein